MISWLLIHFNRCVCVRSKHSWPFPCKQSAVVLKSNCKKTAVYVAFVHPRNLICMVVQKKGGGGGGSISLGGPKALDTRAPSSLALHCTRYMGGICKGAPISFLHGRAHLCACVYRPNGLGRKIVTIGGNLCFGGKFEKNQTN